MEPRKLTKEDIDKVRHIEGFPIAKDEDIISLSNAPYYTACPNPFIEEFINGCGKKYDEVDDDYHIEPYTDDVAEDKHDLIYNIHGYHTKVPPKAIMKFIEHYTNKGDILFDGFSGSGMTGVAAQLCEESSGMRNAIISDISSYATFIAANYNNPNNDTVIQELENLIEEIKRTKGSYYKTLHVQDNKIMQSFIGDSIEGDINYVVWSCIYFCPHCNHEMVYYEILEKYNIKSTQAKFKCPNCNVEVERNKLGMKRSSDIDLELGINTTLVARVPVLINYSVGKKRFTKKPDDRDIEKLNELNRMKIELYPKSEMLRGDETERLFRVGITHVKQLYPRRALYFLSEFYKGCRFDNKKLFLITSALPKLTILNRYMPEHGSRALVGPRAGTYYLPPLFVENDVIGQLEFQLKKLKNLHYKKGNTLVTTQSTTDLSNIPENCIDYIFIDPPFGANIMYSELNFVPEDWIGVKTANPKEAIINKTQGKGLLEYQSLMTKCFSELFRILKPNRWITIEFHNSKNSIWNSIQEALSVAGFIVADVRTLNKEKKTINQYTAAGCVDQDLIISAYKPKESFAKLFINNTGHKQTAWEFVTQHLDKLPPVIIKNNTIEIVAERQAILLFDRMVAYHIVKGLPIPLDSIDFYFGLDERYLKRDGMYFLPDQVNEYDTARITNDVEPIQFELFVTNERSAIAWLYQQLDMPQSYAEIQPKFMQEIKAWDKFEKRPELNILLEENFLQDESGRWYVPNVTKSADVIRLREKKLYKEFEGYLETKGKLKLFRSEAIRVGFAKLWDDKNYKLIVETADRLPESVIQEDDKLLMYYDISLGRI